MTLWEAFMLGWQFRSQAEQCHDARDVGRAMTCDFWPEEFHGVATEIQWTRERDVGISDAMAGIKRLLEQQNSLR